MDTADIMPADIDWLPETVFYWRKSEPYGLIWFVTLSLSFMERTIMGVFEVERTVGCYYEVGLYFHTCFFMFKLTLSFSPFGGMWVWLVGVVSVPR